MTFPMMMMMMIMMMTPLPYISSFVVVPTTNSNSNSNKIQHHPHHHHHQQQEQQNSYFKPLKAAAALDDNNNNGNINNNNENENDNLTKEELLLRLAETRQYYRDNNKNGLGVEDQELCLRLLSTRLTDLQLNRCTVRNSTIPNAGNGLFASRNIKNGELITLYPGDAVIIRKDEQEQNENCQGDNKKNKKKIIPLITNVMFGDHIDIKDRKIDRVLTYESRGYETELNDYISIIGDPNYSHSNNNILPGQIQYDTSYCAHYANDGAYLNDFDSTKRELYQKNTVSKYNSANFIMEDGAHVGMVATKDIIKDQEIFLSYGEGYWLSRIVSDLKNNNSGNGNGSSSSSNGAAAATTTKEEAENMLTDIMSNMSERRKNVVNKKATTLTSSSMLSTATATATATGGGGGFKKSSSANNANKKKNKNKKKTTTKNSNTSSTSSKGFAK